MVSNFRRRFFLRNSTNYAWRKCFGVKIRGRLVAKNFKKFPKLGLKPPSGLSRPPILARCVCFAKTRFLGIKKDAPYSKGHLAFVLICFLIDSP